MTTGEITKQAMKVLDLMGFECWRNNNVRAEKGQMREAMKDHLKNLYREKQ